ncbi:hypothetical protein MYXO_00289 [Myxococcaceae bacterium]|jgi:uncharacterized membrane protein YdjX (TVP38/TMEM64 family)|nr:hypothetical protein MYXO_00289 [Myxococcaceae bacterium]
MLAVILTAMAAGCGWGSRHAMLLGRLDGRQKKPLAALVVLALLMMGAHWAKGSFGVEWTAASLRDLVERAGIWGPVVFVALLSIRPVLVIPSQLLMIAGGICFGGFAGALYAAFGITIGGILAYGVTRWIGRDLVLERMPAGVRSALEGGGRFATLGVIFAGSAYPIGPILWLCIGAALAGVTLVPFTLVLFSGGFIRAALYAYFGSSLVDAELHEILLGSLAIGAVALLPLLHPRVRSWLGQLRRES